MTMLSTIAARFLDFPGIAVIRPDWAKCALCKSLNTLKTPNCFFPCTHTKCSKQPDSLKCRSSACTKTFMVDNNLSVHHQRIWAFLDFILNYRGNEAEFPYYSESNQLQYFDKKQLPTNVFHYPATRTRHANFIMTLWSLSYTSHNAVL